MRYPVVDAAAPMRRIVVGSLQRPGLSDLVEAGDGREALAGSDASVGFAITDRNVPNMRGIELARALGARGDGGRPAPTLMMTARSVKKDILTAFEAGVSDYVVKPLTPQVLKETIDALLAAPAAT